MDGRVETHLLRLFVGFYGYLGIQLYEIQRKWQSFFNILVNLAIIFSVLLGLFLMDPYNIEAGTAWLQEHFKPLVGLVIQTDAIYVHPMAYLCHVIYFVRNGRRIVRLLDNECFNQVYRSLSREWLIFCGMILLYSIVFVLLHYGHIVMTPTEEQKAIWKIISILCMFVLHQIQCMIMGIMHYAKYATYKVLKSLLLKLDSNSNIEYEQTINQIKTMAKLNAELHQLLSFSLMMFWVKSIIDSIAFICLFQATSQDYGIFLYIYSSFYSIYIVHLDQQIQKTLVLIYSRMQSKNHCTKLFQITFNRNLSKLLHEDSNEQFETQQSVQIRLKQMQMYSEHFKMRMFRMCYLDYQFILAVALFIFNYSVLVIQTSNK